MNQTINKLRIECKEYFNQLNARKNSYSFQKLIRPILKSDLHITGTGFQNIEDKTSAEDDVDTLKESIIKLKDIYKNSVLYGNCGVMIYEISDEQLNLIIQNINSLIDTNSLFVKSFPLSIPTDQLKKIKNSQGQFCKIEKINDDIDCLVFCARRLDRTREKIDNNNFINQANLSSYDEIYGYKINYHQAFDKIFINKKNNLIYFFIDQCTKSILTEETIRYFVTDYIKKLNSLIENKKKETIKNNPTNFFKLISIFYNNNEGYIKKLDHITDTNSTKTEKMRKNGVDLRLEPFHEGGLANVQNTNMYAIHKSWDPVAGVAKPTILLPGNNYQITSTNPKLEYAIIEDCSTKEDFLFLLEKLI